MRSILKRISLLAAALMIIAVPALSDEIGVGSSFEKGQQPEKNECLLVAMNCGNQVDSIQQRIDRIKGEIARGSAVYTNEELRRLNRELEEAVKTMDDLTLGG